MGTWLVVAAEKTEFAGILRRAKSVKVLSWPAQVRYAAEIEWRHGRGLLIANGAGPALVRQALGQKPKVDLIISIGFAGALDQSLRIGDIVVSGDFGNAVLPKCLKGAVLSIDRVAVTAEDKRQLREQTGASVVEMESSAVQARASEWGIPFLCVRSVSDVAGDDMPLDFNRYRQADGDFSRPKIAAAAIIHPFTVLPGLLRLNSNCRIAAEALGEFLVNC